MLLKVLKILLFFYIFTSCSNPADKKVKNISSDDKKIFHEGMKFNKDKKYDKAIEKFKKINDEFPYSDLAQKAKIYNAYLSYKTNDFDKAIILLVDYINMNPSGEFTDYAYYLLAMCYYVQIAEPDRDGEFTKKAIEKFNLLRKKFTESKFSKDARFKLDFLNDFLAQKEFNIAMFYLKKNAPSPAINRFSKILKNYQGTSVIPQTLYRISECFLILGLKKEAKKSLKLLEVNFPKSKWTAELKILFLDKNKVNKKESKSFFGRFFQKI